VSAAFAQSGYHQVKKITIGGDGSWDYLVVDGGRVYVSHTNEVAVVDTKTGEVAARSRFARRTRIAIASEFGRGYISNGRSNTVTIFDLKTLAKIGAEVPTGKNPDASSMIRLEANLRVQWKQQRCHRDRRQRRHCGGTIPVDGKPEFAAGDGKGHVYVNIEDKSSVYDIDSKKLT